MAGFERLGLMDELCRATEEMGWVLPTDVQDEAIPLILGGGDVLIAAETGSGKTGAFCLPLLQVLHETLTGKAQVRAAEHKADAAALRAEAEQRGVALNARDRDEWVALNEDGTLCQARDAEHWGGCRSNWGVTEGKWYFEVTVTDEGLCRVGWATAAAAREIGTDRQSFGFGGTGMKSFGNAFQPYGEKFGLGDVIGCRLDLDARVVSFAKNGRDLGVAWEVPRSIAGQAALFAAVSLRNAEVRVNFGGAPLRHPPAGFSPMAAARPEQLTLFEPQQAAAREGRQGASRAEDLHRLPLALVVEPTRELAQQVADELDKFKARIDPPISHELFIGGGDDGRRVQNLKRGVNIVIGTPGRLSALLREGVLDLREVRFFVLDEADRLIEDSGKEFVLDAHKRLNTDHLQVIVCSATLHSEPVTQLAAKVCVRPTWVDLKGKDAVPEFVDHVVVEVDPEADRSWAGRKADLSLTDGVHAETADQVARGLVNADTLSCGVKLLKPQALLRVIDAFQMSQCMVFCRTQVDCDNLEALLVREGGGRRFAGKAEKGVEGRYSCVCLHSGLDQRQRTANLQAFKDGDVKFLICTDLAARGIDVAELPFVINMTLPDAPEQYVHRIGRVGRAECPGLAISLVAKVKEKVWYHKCNRPDRGRGCRNTRDISQGGCTIIYDEPALLAAVETRLGARVPRLDPSALVRGREAFLRAAAAGQLRRDPAAEAARAHLEMLAPAVQELAALEVRAQQSFVASRAPQHWRAIAGKALAGADR